jgi:hypothetical protein
MLSFTLFAKMKKQFDFANKEYPYVLIIGSEVECREIYYAKGYGNG